MRLDEKIMRGIFGWFERWALRDYRMWFRTVGNVKHEICLMICLDHLQSTIFQVTIDRTEWKHVFEFRRCFINWIKLRLGNLCSQWNKNLPWLETHVDTEIAIHSGVSKCWTMFAYRTLPYLIPPSQESDRKLDLEQVRAIGESGTGKAPALKRGRRTTQWSLIFNLWPREFDLWSLGN